DGHHDGRVAAGDAGLARRLWGDNRGDGIDLDLPEGAVLGVLLTDSVTAVGLDAAILGGAGAVAAAGDRRSGQGADGSRADAGGGLGQCPHGWPRPSAGWTSARSLKQLTTALFL